MLKMHKLNHLWIIYWVRKETRSLKNAELHRLVLLEQLKLTRLQIEREEIVLKKLANSTDEMSITLF